MGRNLAWKVGVFVATYSVNREELVVYSTDEHVSETDSIADLQQRNKDLQKTIVETERELRKEKEQLQLEEANHKTMLTMEKYILSQFLCQPAADKLDNMEASEKELKSFISDKCGYKLTMDDTHFETVPTGFSNYYCLVKIQPEQSEGTDSEMTFAGKGSSSKEAMVQALSAVQDFLKRSTAFSNKLLGPNQDILEKLVQVLKLSNVGAIPFKVTENKLFSLFEASLFNNGQNYKSVFSRTADEARLDVAKKVLRSMDYILYSDALNLRLAV